MVNYQQQTVGLLTQISRQFASIAPQVPIPSPPSLQPYPAFSPSPSDVRVNVFWFMSLVFSLSAALSATLVQQWVRYHMQVFRYGHPLKSARLRHYLYEGLEDSHMLVVAQAVPGLLHVSLFLFFVGLLDSLWNLNKVVFRATVVPISLCGFFYIFSTFSPVIKPQWPYQNPLSGLFWYLCQKAHIRKYWGRPRGKELKPVSSDMAEGQLQLAMEVDEGCKGRDERAIRWLFNNVTEDTEMESFALAIPGSFNPGWGNDVWNKVFNTSEEGHVDSNPSTGSPVRSDDRAPSTSDVQGRQYLHLIKRHRSPDESSLSDDSIFKGLCQRIGHLLQTCTNRGLFANEDARQKRIRACIDVVASLVFTFRAELDWFGEIEKVLSELGIIEKTPPSGVLPAVGTHQSLTARWTCLSLVAIRQKLRDNQLSVLAGYVVDGLARFQLRLGSSEENALESVKEIDRRLREAWNHVEVLHRAFEPWDGKTRDQREVEEILDRHEPQVSGLEDIKHETDVKDSFDWRVSLLQDAMDQTTHRLTRRLPGLLFDELKRTGPALVSDAFKFDLIDSTPVLPQLVFPIQQVRGLYSLGTKFRDIMEGRSTEGYEEALKSLKSIDRIPIRLRRLKDPMKQQLWRLQDLRDNHGLGYTVELFFLATRQLVSTSSPQELDSFFYESTFKAITSPWKEGKDSLGTQHILLNLICDLVIEGRGVFSDCTYPENITAGLLALTTDILHEHKDPRTHIDDAFHELQDVSPQNCFDSDLRDKALDAINRSQSSETVI